MTVSDNIAFPLRRLYKLPEDEIRARVAERLKCVSLPGFEARMPAGLSGGQKKRIGVARATVARAPVVFYDEPAAGLDPAHRDGPRRHDVPRATDLRRHDRGGASLSRSVRASVRARDP
jgi:ABC-type transporter Mla maintaining outer membrane lipid asymmetry ATPase subunit MlaF